MSGRAAGPAPTGPRPRPAGPRPVPGRRPPGRPGPRAQRGRLVPRPARRLPAGARHCQQALALHQQLGDRDGEAAHLGQPRLRPPPPRPPRRGRRLLPAGPRPVPRTRRPLQRSRQPRPPRRHPPRHRRPHTRPAPPGSTPCTSSPNCTTPKPTHSASDSPSCYRTDRDGAYQTAPAGSDHNGPGTRLHRAARSPRSARPERAADGAAAGPVRAGRRQDRTVAAPAATPARRRSPGRTASW